MKTTIAVLALALAGAIVPGAALAQSAGRISGAESGNAERGRELFMDKDVARCILCHRPPGEKVGGNIGATLRGIGGRMSEGEICIRIMDITKVRADPLMPSFYKTDGLVRVAPEWRGKTLLTAQQVEDLVAYVQTLK